MNGEVNLDRDSDSENPGREKGRSEASFFKKKREQGQYPFGRLSHFDEHLRLKILGSRFCSKTFQSLFYFTRTEKGCSRNDAYPALLTFSRFYVISLNFDAQVAELFESGLAWRRGNVVGKDGHSLEGEVFSVRGDERIDGVSLAQRNVCAGFVEEDWCVVFRRMFWKLLLRQGFVCALWQNRV